MVTTLLDRGAQAHQAILVSHLTPYDPAFQQRFTMLEHLLGSAEKAYGVIYQSLVKQAALLAYVDNFRLFALICTISALAAFLFKKVKAKQSVAAH